MTDELVKGIRRIVGDLDEKPKGIGDAEARKPIGISRGIAYIGRDGGVSSSGSAEGGGNDTSPPNVPQPDTDPDNGAPGDTGGINDGSTGGGTGSALTGDVADVDAQITGGSEIGLLTGTDPSTGTLTTVNLNTLEGIEFTPPDEWGGPDSPPDYEEGFHWLSDGESFKATHPQAVADLAAASFGGTWTYTLDCFGDQRIYRVSGLCNAVGLTNSRNLTKRSCVGFESESYCQAPTADWPSDSTCQIVYDHNSGGYAGNSRDPDCSEDQKAAKSFTIARSQTQPDKYFRYTRLANGGTKITQVDAGGAPVPGSITKTVSADGTVDGFYDVSLDAGIN